MLPPDKETFHDDKADGTRNPADADGCATGPDAGRSGGGTDQGQSRPRFVKYLSLASAVGALLGFGMLVWASERGGMGSGASEMKERFGKVILSVIVVLTATSIVSFVV